MTSTPKSMSYAGPASRSGADRTTRMASNTGAGAPSRAKAGRAPARPPTPPRYTAASAGTTDWRDLALFGAGLALGVLVGAGAALMAAPASGAETRAVLRARAARAQRSVIRRGHDVWDDFGNEIRTARLALRRRKARRALDAELDEV